LNGDNLIANQLENTVHNRFKALKNLFIGEGHVALLDAGVREVSLNTHIYSPLLPVVTEIGLDAVLKVHDTLRVYLACSPRAIRQLHLTDLRSQDVTEIPVQCC
jgi:hypothetical protein